MRRKIELLKGGDLCVISHLHFKTAPVRVTTQLAHSQRHASTHRTALIDEIYEVDHIYILPPPLDDIDLSGQRDSWSL